jgi:hypothetical protein
MDSKMRKLAPWVIAIVAAIVIAVILLTGGCATPGDDGTVDKTAEVVVEHKEDIEQTVEVAKRWLPSPLDWILGGVAEVLLLGAAWWVGRKQGEKKGKADGS